MHEAVLLRELGAEGKLDLHHSGLDPQEFGPEGFHCLHAGIVTTVVDTACGYAAYTLMPPDASVLTVEFKVNFLAPARGRRFRARGTVVKAGKTLSVCHGEVFALSEDGEKLIVNMSATMMTVRNGPDVTPG